MSNYKRCAKCGEYSWDVHHKCQRFVAKIPAWTDGHEHECWGTYVDEVIEKLVERINEDSDYGLERSEQTIRVHIAPFTEGELEWTVYGVHAFLKVEYDSYVLQEPCK